MDSDQDIFVRNLELESCDVNLTFLQKQVGEVNCVIWDAAIVLAKYLDFANQKTNKWLKGKKLLELGAGLGCAGLTAACLGANVVLTDLKSALPMLIENVKANEDKWKSLGLVEVEVLEWGKEMQTDFSSDIILLTDCVYYEESVEPLLDTLNILLDNKSGSYAILSQEERDTPKQVVVWKKFYTELNKRFKVEIIPIAQQHPTYSSPDIHLMKIHKL